MLLLVSPLFPFSSQGLIIIAMHWGKGSSLIIISLSANTAQIFPRDFLEIQSPAPTTYSLYDSFCGNTHTIHRHRHGDDFLVAICMMVQAHPLHRQYILGIIAFIQHATAQCAHGYIYVSQNNQHVLFHLWRRL